MAKDSTIYTLKHRLCPGYRNCAHHSLFKFCNLPIEDFNVIYDQYVLGSNGATTIEMCYIVDMLVPDGSYLYEVDNRNVLDMVYALSWNMPEEDSRAICLLSDHAVFISGPVVYDTIETDLQRGVLYIITSEKLKGASFKEMK